MIIGESPLKDLYRLLVWGGGPELAQLVPAPGEARMLRAMGRAAAQLLPRKHAQIRDNIHVAFPHRKDCAQLASAAFAAHFANQYISLSIPKIHTFNAHRYLRWEGMDRIEAALQKGGLVLAHPHMGPAQLPLHALGLRFPSVHQIGGGEVHLVQKSTIGEWASQRRAELEQNIAATLHDGKTYLRPALRALKAGGIVLTACDATGGGKEIGRRLEATILGQDFPLPVGHLWFAWKAQVPLFPLYCTRDPQKRSLYLARVGDPIELFQYPKAEAFEVGTRWTEHFLNDVLAQHPEAWLFWDGFCKGGLIR